MNHKNLFLHSGGGYHGACVVTVYTWSISCLYIILDI